MHPPTPLKLRKINKHFKNIFLILKFELLFFIDSVTVRIFLTKSNLYTYILRLHFMNQLRKCKFCRRSELETQNVTKSENYFKYINLKKSNLIQ